jgi:tetratricopeptide (TPR) repeat protein
MQNRITRAAAMLLAIGLLAQTPRLDAQSTGPGLKQPTTKIQNSTPVDLLYRQGMAAFEQQDWMQALIKFERVQLAQPNYRDTGKLVALSRANLLQQAPGAGAGIAIGNSAVPIVIVGVSLLGLLSWLPANRAHFHRLFGNYAGAAMIYERLVVRKPSRMKLYPALAEAYLRLNRRDATAMRIYKRVLELNLPTALRAELHNLVTGYNLDEMQTKWHVNEVLDSRLEKKLPQGLGAVTQPKPSPVENPQPPRRPRKPAKGKKLFADFGYAGGLFLNGKLQIEKY